MRFIKCPSSKRIFRLKNRPIARSESSNRTPIYKMHKWFARRVGSTFRALIAGTLSEENPWDRFYDPAPLQDGRGHPYVILDPFMGGGTTLVEGHLLGCKVIAWMSTPSRGSSPERAGGVSGKKIKEAFEQIATQLETPLRNYYKQNVLTVTTPRSFTRSGSGKSRANTVVRACRFSRPTR